MSSSSSASPKSKSGKSPWSLPMWKIFIGLSFSRSLILTMPSLEKQSWMRPLCFNSLQLQAIDSFMGVKFSLAKTFVFRVKLCLLQSILPSFFLLNKTFLQFFLFAKPMTGLNIFTFNKNINISQNWYHWLFQDIFRNQLWNST